MLFPYTFTIPANTEKTSPAKMTFTLREGILTEITILIPPGHCDLAHLVIKDGDTQIVPELPAESVHGDNIVLRFRVDRYLYQPFYDLYGYGWNDDDTYDHDFILYFEVEPRAIAYPHELIVTELKYLSALMRAFLGI